MDLTIRTSAGELLALQTIVPPGFAAIRIPGTVAWSYQDERGTIFIEEFSTGAFTIRFIFFQFIQKAGIYWQEHLPIMRARIVLKGNWLLRPGGTSGLSLRMGQSLLYTPGMEAEELLFDKEHQYRCFDTQFTVDRLKGFAPLFPGLDDLIDSGATSFSQRIHWVKPAMEDILRSIERCPFEGSLREYYIEHKLEELMLLLLQETLKQQPGSIRLPDHHEIIAVQHIERIIIADIRVHIPIRVLARMSGLNALRLKYVFKHVFGEGIFEHLLRARMREAHILLAETDKPIKEISHLTGYSYLSSFINAFRKYYGYTPGSMRRD